MSQGDGGDRSAPLRRQASAVASASAAASTSTNITLAPARASPSAIALPSPRAAPVTIATRPSRRMSLVEVTEASAMDCSYGFGG